MKVKSRGKYAARWCWVDRRAACVIVLALWTDLRIRWLVYFVSFMKLRALLINTQTNNSTRRPSTQCVSSGRSLSKMRCMKHFSHSPFHNLRGSAPQHVLGDVCSPCLLDIQPRLVYALAAPLSIRSSFPWAHLLLHEPSVRFLITINLRSVPVYESRIIVS